MWIAVAMLCVGVGLAVPMVRVTYWNSDSGVRRRLEDQRGTDERLAQNILLFNEPLAREQEIALIRFTQDRPIDPKSAVEAARHYSRSTHVLWALATLRTAPPECLRIIYQDSLQLPETQSLQLQSEIGMHPNTPIDILEQMAQSSDARLGELAFRNPKLPRSEKVAYLIRAADSSWSSQRAMVAADPDTPQPVLRKLGSDPGLNVIYALLLNPSTPVDVVEKFAHGEYSPETRVEAERVLTLRAQVKPSTK